MTTGPDKDSQRTGKADEEEDAASVEETPDPNLPTPPTPDPAGDDPKPDKKEWM